MLPDTFFGATPLTPISTLQVCVLLIFRTIKKMKNEKKTEKEDRALVL
jgi:hypothetical protein